MNKERVQLLIDALRSGKYKQGTLVLCRNGKHCIWGVGFEVARANGYLMMTGWIDDTTLSYDGMTHKFNDKLLEWYGISQELASKLMTLNDDYTSFEGLADILERELAKRYPVLTA